MSTIFIQKITEIVQTNFSNELFGSRELAEKMGINRVQLYRKLKAATNKSASEFIREFRLKKGKELLENEELHVSEVSFRVGFASPTYFSRCFHAYYGYPPGEVLKGNVNKESSLESIQEKQAQPKSYKKKLVIALVLFLILPGFVVLIAMLKPFSFQQKQLEKTIAVLPFIDDSPEDGNEYILHGLREEFMAKLASLENIKLVSRHTSDQYKNSKKNIKQIGKELKANYILEGSGQAINGKTKISLRLIEATSDKQLWTKPIEMEITEDNIFEVQQEIAFQVANDLGVELTSTEITQLKETVQVNKTAYHYFLQGKNWYNIFLDDRQNYYALIQSKYCFHNAIKFDSTYVDATCYMAQALFKETKFLWSQSKYDSAVLMINKALLLDPYNYEAYCIKGFLSQCTNIEETKSCFENAIRYGPDKPEGYYQMGNFLCNYGDFANSISFSLKAIEKSKEPIVYNWTLINLNFSCAALGCYKEAEKFRKEYILQYNKQIIGFNMQQNEEMMKGKYLNAVKTGLEAYQLDTTDLTTLAMLGDGYLFLRDFKNSRKYYQKYIENIIQPLGCEYKTDSYDFAFVNNQHTNSIGVEIFPLLNLTYLFLHLNENELFCTYSKAIFNDALKHEEFDSRISKIHLSSFEKACIYLMHNDNQKALEMLNLIIKERSCPIWLVRYFKESPLFDNIRNEPEIQKIINILELEYQKQHKEVKEVLAQKI